MILIDDILVSDDVVKKDFVCNLQKCKGACCVEGDSGAPIEPEERKILKKIYPKVVGLTNAGTMPASEKESLMWSFAAS